jgi:hypothetical protein
VGSEAAIAGFGLKFAGFDAGPADAGAAIEGFGLEFAGFDAEAVDAGAAIEGFGLEFAGFDAGAAIAFFCFGVDGFGAESLFQTELLFEIGGTFINGLAIKRSVFCLPCPPFNTTVSPGSTGTFGFFDGTSAIVWSSAAIKVLARAEEFIEP